MVEIADRRFYEKVGRIRDGVRDMDKGNRKITKLKNTVSKLNPLDNRLEFEFGQFVIGEGSGDPYRGNDGSCGKIKGKPPI